MDIAALGGVGTSSPQTILGNEATLTSSSSTTSSVLNRYTSPVLTFDSETGAVILQYRDSVSGADLYQFPSKVTLQYEQAQRLAELVKHS